MKRSLSLTLLILVNLGICLGCGSGGSSCSEPLPDIHWKGFDSKYENPPAKRPIDARHTRKP
jgi:hypothetical protein